MPTCGPNKRQYQLSSCAPQLLESSSTWLPSWCRCASGQPFPDSRNSPNCRYLHKIPHTIRHIIHYSFYFRPVCSVICHLLETSTNPDAVEPAASIVPLAQWPRDYDASAIYAGLRDTLTTYHDRQELFVTCGKAMTHLCIQSVKIERRMMGDAGYLARQRLFYSRCILAGCDALDKLRMATTTSQRRTHLADARTTLRTCPWITGWGPVMALP